MSNHYMIDRILSLPGLFKNHAVVIKNSLGTWINGATDTDGCLTCPDCRRSEWSIRGIAISCNYCYSSFENYGKYGLKPIEKVKPIEHELQE